MTMTLEMAVKRVEELEKQMAVVMSKVEDKKVEEKKPKVGKVVKEVKEVKSESPKKKRGMTGYLLFSKEMRGKVKDELGEVKPTEVVTEVAKRWKGLDEEKRMEWNERAKNMDDTED